MGRPPKIWPSLELASGGAEVFARRSIMMYSKDQPSLSLEPSIVLRRMRLSTLHHQPVACLKLHLLLRIRSKEKKQATGQKGWYYAATLPLETLLAVLQDVGDEQLFALRKQSPFSMLSVTRVLVLCHVIRYRSL